MGEGIFSSRPPIPRPCLVRSDTGSVATPASISKKASYDTARPASTHKIGPEISFYKAFGGKHARAGTMQKYARILAFCLAILLWALKGALVLLRVFRRAILTVSVGWLGFM